MEVRATGPFVSSLAMDAVAIAAEAVPKVTRACVGKIVSGDGKREAGSGERGAADGVVKRGMGS